MSLDTFLLTVVLGIAGYVGFVVLAFLTTAVILWKKTK